MKPTYLIMHDIKSNPNLINRKPVKTGCFCQTRTKSENSFILQKCKTKDPEQNPKLFFEYPWIWNGNESYSNKLTETWAPDYKFKN